MLRFSGNVLHAKWHIQQLRATALLSDLRFAKSAQCNLLLCHRSPTKTRLRAFARSTPLGHTQRYRIDTHSQSAVHVKVVGTLTILELELGQAARLEACLRRRPRHNLRHRADNAVSPGVLQQRTTHAASVHYMHG